MTNLMDFLNKIPPNITIVAVTKNQSVQQIKKLPTRITDVAENKIQEAEQKFAQLSDRKFKKHFIGNLQKNKINKAIQLFDVIQSVDSEELAEEINKKATKPIEIMLQINISNDPAKFGFSPKEVKTAISKVNKLKNLKIIGLMTILKEYDNPKDTKKDFLDMQNLFMELNKSIMQKTPMKHLSMGMSQDFEQALEAGSNMLRLGTIIFQNL